MLVEVAPYWNVNIHTWNEFLSRKSVEVAPYWNVNKVTGKGQQYFINVEVAPYWNVNANNDVLDGIRTV